MKACGRWTGNYYPICSGLMHRTTPTRSPHNALHSPIVIGASLSEPHISESNCGFSIYIYIHRTSFRKCKLALLTRNVAHAEFKCGRNIEKNTWSVSTLLYSSLEPYLRVLPSSF